MIETVTKGNIKIIILCKIPANTLDINYLKEIYKTLLDIENDKNISGVVLTSNNKSVFSSGLDLRSISSKLSKLNRRYLIYAVWLVYQNIKLIMCSDKVYTASLSGAVIGSAMSLVIACDFRFAANNTWFWLPDPQYGGLLADGGLDIIKNICGLAYAKQICLCNERIGSESANSLGLVHKIIHNNNVDEYSFQYTLDLCNKYSLHTLKTTKAILNKNILMKFQFVKLLRVVYSDEMTKRLLKYNLWERK